MAIESILSDFIKSDLSKGAKLDAIDPHASLIHEGIIDSMAILHLLAFIEDQFGITIKDEEMVLDNFQTIDSIRSFIEAKKQEQGN